MVDERIRNEEKIIGNYKVKFKTSFNDNESDFIFLDISISEDLKKLIKGIIVKDEKIDFEYYNGEDSNKYKRYLVKKWVYGALYGEGKDFLFEKGLIDRNKLKVKILSVDRIDKIMSDFKENLKRLIEVVLKYSKIDVSVNFNPSKKDE